ncbi:MAG TPA: hypothetical protein VMG08_14760 [Allosphingosinicella sp.]|nr:hypothetical protein [Allosphingosinicella sp.]
MFLINLLKSLDELVYEVMSWLVFYPVTLWRTMTRPLKIMDYSDKELGDRADRQYEAALSPPLFLLITLFISHGLELSLVGDSPIVRETSGLAGLVNDDGSLLMLRLLTFSIFPLVMAAELIALRRSPLTRDSLRPAFFAQCYVAAPFALAVTTGATLINWRPDSWLAHSGLALFCAALLWYGTLQTRWFVQHLRTTIFRGFLAASLAMVLSVALVAAVLLFFR